MNIHEQMLKPVTEAKYLAVENTERYRPIIRLFYHSYEKLKYWMYQEEIYEQLKESPYFAGYTQEQCQQDLTALVNWGNLTAIQDSRKAATIEEFKNKKYKYQLSEYGVEIERLVVRLENLAVEGASLEPTLLERIRRTLENMTQAMGGSDETLYTWWNDLNNDFIRLNQNYKDYMRDLNSIKAEEMMQTKAFLVFKDRLIDYLRNFVKSLQMNVGVIEQLLTAVSDDLKEGLFGRITAYELAIPRMDTTVSEKQIYEKVLGRWQSLTEWFTESDGRPSEAGQVFDTTNDIIRKITRYAARISEHASGSVNRREEYAKLASVFSRCENLAQAHRLSACVFGIERPLHLKGDFRRKTDSINSGIFEEEPSVVTVQPRIRNYKEKITRSGIEDRSMEKARMRQRLIEEHQAQRRLLQSYIKDGRLDFWQLPVLDGSVRDVFLAWLSKALENKEHRAKTEDGLIYYVDMSRADQTCRLVCTDGVFTMPCFSIVFENMQAVKA